MANDESITDCEVIVTDNEMMVEMLNEDTEVTIIEA